VPRFEPFAGLRYASDRVRLDDVIAPPYDVITPEEQLALDGRSQYNAVRVELPRDEPGVDRYRVAARLFAQWRAESVLVRDPEPVFYGYRMTFSDETGAGRHSIGVIGALGLEAPGSGGPEEGEGPGAPGPAGILPHERTTPKAKSDRLQLLRATRANLSPIWGLSLADDLAELITTPTEPAARAVDDDGVTHELWLIDEPDRKAAMARAVASAPVVIADGHHRFETALTYQRERREATGDRPGPYDLVMALIVQLAEEQLFVRAIHRLISGLPADVDLTRELSPNFSITPTDPPDVTIGRRMQAAGGLALVTTAGTWLLVPRPALGSSAAHRDLDSSRVDAALAGLPPHEVTYQHEWELAAAAVAKGAAQAAILVRPVTVAQISETGRGGERMPPKTTFFWPKPRTGLVFREVSG
jgi:uncharacterized protein (DUF1015 family)